VLLEALALAEPELELELALAELELELELEHPAVPSRPAATVAPSQVAVRRLKMFTNHLYAIPVTYGTPELDAQVNGPWQEEKQTLHICLTLRSVHPPLSSQNCRQSLC
jgi:hypothetical protein